MLIQNIGVPLWLFSGEDVLDKALRQYRIPFVGLKNGTHYFNFEVDNRFFTNFENAPIQQSLLNVFITFEKKESHFYLIFDIEGTVKTECDRCLKTIDLPVEFRHPVYIKFHDQRTSQTNEDPDIIYIDPGETFIDLVDLIYEFSVLSLPIQKTCEDTIESKACDPKVLEKLEKKKKKNEGKKNNDPRWDQLKKLNLK